VCGEATPAPTAAWPLAFGIGSSEVVHVLATQTIVQRRPSGCGHLRRHAPAGRDAKDMILHLIGVIGAAGGTG